MSVVELPLTWQRCRAALESLAAAHPDQCRLATFGTTAGGRSLDALYIGSGDYRVLYSGAHHVNEWLTAPLLLMFAEAVLDGTETLPPEATVCLVPMVDPDGVDLVTGAIGPGTESYEKARSLSENYPSIPFPDGWKANLAGVDLNLNYPAKWLMAREIKFSQGFTRPGPRDYVGRFPLDQPETKALATLTYQFDPALVLAYHSQGQVIYWQFGDYNIPGAQALGEEFAALSGYALSDTPFESSFAGYKDWFIQEFRRPGYTVEVGLGDNPLPNTQLPQIYRENLPILLRAARK